MNILILYLYGMTHMKRLVQLFAALTIGILIILFSTGCDGKKKSTYEFRSLPKNEALDVLMYTNAIRPLKCFRMSDKTYAIPSVKWIQEVFTPEFKNYLFRNNLKTVRDSINDCDKYCLHARSVASVLYSKETKRIPGAALAMGEFVYWYGLDMHDIVFFLAYDETYGDLVMVFYEPMIQNIIIFEPRDAGCVDCMM
jgi:hypothetical protein